MGNRNYDSKDFIQYLVFKTTNGKIKYSVNVTKAQKLLYVLYGTFMSLNNGARLMEEQPRAWPYGPVFPTTRNKLIKIDDMYSIKKEDIKHYDTYENDKALQQALSFTLDNFGRFTATQLSNWTHREGAPWATTTNKEDFSWGAPIEDSLIKNYFDSIITV